MLIQPTQKAARLISGVGTQTMNDSIDIIPLRIFFQELLAVLKSVIKILCLLFAAIIIFGLILWRLEPLCFWQAQYLAFITALTVGYGDFYPKSTIAQMISILLGFLGIMLTGTIVAIVIRAIQRANSTMRKKYGEKRT